MSYGLNEGVAGTSSSYLVAIGTLTADRRVCAVLDEASLVGPSNRCGVEATTVFDPSAAGSGSAGPTLEGSGSCPAVTRLNVHFVPPPMQARNRPRTTSRPAARRACTVTSPPIGAQRLDR
jgi:hypothetical protein